VTAAVVVLTVLGIGLAGAGWRARGGGRLQLGLAVAMCSALALAAVPVLVAGSPAVWGPAGSRTLLVLLGALAVAGGGPLAVAVLSVADRTDVAEPPEEGAEPPEAGEVLRGGAWIGSLERLGVFATLAAGWPEGVAVVLAVKGVGRYQELDASGAAERFIIGTFASVLWAVACAGVWWFGSWPPLRLF
jgi:hypothetical protein